MLSPNELRALSDNNVAEIGWVFEGMTEEPLAFLLVKSNRDKELFTFRVFYFDVPLGDWVAKIQADEAAPDGEKVIWVKADRK